MIEELIQEGQQIGEIENAEMIKNEYIMWFEKSDNLWGGFPPRFFYLEINGN